MTTTSDWSALIAKQGEQRRAEQEEATRVAETQLPAYLRTYNRMPLAELLQRYLHHNANAFNIWQPRRARAIHRLCRMKVYQQIDLRIAELKLRLNEANDHASRLQWPDTTGQ